LLSLLDSRCGSILLQRTGFVIMSCIIEGSLEILRPVTVAVKVLKGDDENAFVQQHQQTQHLADEEPKESRTSKQKQGEEESDDLDEDDSYTNRDEASDSEEEDELPDEEASWERATAVTRKERNEEAQWRSKFELLRQYKQENGHFRVPRCYEINGVRLGCWLNTQRNEYKKHCEGRPSCITQERIDELTTVGLDFHDIKQKRAEAQWQSKLELLRMYKQENGHCRVPQHDEINGVRPRKGQASKDFTRTH